MENISINLDNKFKSIYICKSFILLYLIIKMRLLKKLLLATALLAVGKAQAQMPHDAIYMPARSTCFALSYGNSSWTNYWENTLKRENLNLGRVSTESLGLMAAVGLNQKTNVIVSVPYIRTQTSAGNLLGQKGLQDASLWVKYKINPAGKVNFHAIVGASTPVSNYVPDFLPLSIGLGAKTLEARLLAHYTHKSLYLTAHAGYTLRGKITIDKDAYQAYNQVINQNQVNVPDAVNFAIRVGYLKKALQAEAFIEDFSCIKGDYIRRNDMPFPTNKMQFSAAGVYVKYQPKLIGFNARISQVLSGTNIGQSLSFSAGILYQLNYFKK